MVHIKDHCGLSDSCPATGLLTLPIYEAGAGHDGKWLTKLSVLCEAAPLYAPQGVEMGGGGSPSKTWIDTAGWPEPVADAQCKALSIMPGIP